MTKARSEDDDVPPQITPEKVSFGSAADPTSLCSSLFLSLILSRRGSPWTTYFSANQNNQKREDLANSVEREIPVNHRSGASVEGTTDERAGGSGYYFP